jgi:hypothetical protein
MLSGYVFENKMPSNIFVTKGGDIRGSLGNCVRNMMIYALLIVLLYSAKLNYVGLLALDTYGRYMKQIHFI